MNRFYRWWITCIITDFCIDMNMNADLIVVDSCGTNGDWQNNNSFYFLISILCSFNISMNRDAFFFHFCILLLLLYSHFYYICSYFIVFYCFFNTRISINFRFSYTYCYEMHNPLVLLLTIFLYNHDIHGFVLF